MTKISSFGLLAALTCTAGAAVSRPDAGAVRAALIAQSSASDTLTYRFSWGAAVGASGYRVHVYPIAFNDSTPRDTTWQTLPKTQPFFASGTTATAKLINPVWDSARFRVVVRSTRGAIIGRDSSFAEWTVVRLGSPGPIIVDSSLIIIGLEVYNLPVDSIARALCPVLVFHGGRRAMRSQDVGGPCAGVVATLDAISPKQQARADTTPLVIHHTNRSTFRDTSAYTLIHTDEVHN